MKRPVWLVVVLAGALGLGAGAAVRHWLVVSDATPAPGATSSEVSGDATASESNAGESTSIVGDQRPAFSLPDRDGDTRAIGDFDGQVVLLNFWATWCPPCLEEVPALDALHAGLRDRGLRVVGVALEGAEAVQAFADEHGVGYPLLVGGREAFDIATAYGNGQGTLPYSVVIDRSGTVQATHHGALTRAEARALVKPYL